MPFTNPFRYLSKTYPFLYQSITWSPAFIFLFDHGFSLSWVQGTSMYPTFSPDYANGGRRDALLLRKWGASDNIRPGQVVTFRSPTNPKVISIKRVVAVEHDVVSTKKPFPKGACVVPEGHVWVEGDGEYESYDSNSYGPISKALILSKVTGIVFPFSRLGRIEEQVPLATKLRVHKPNSLVTVDSILNS